MKRTVRNDLLLIGAILFICAAIFAVFIASQTEGRYISVQVDGKETARYELSTDIETVITTGENGQYHNVLQIKGGKATVIDADCPDKICAAHKPISAEGETIVCLPHKVVIIVE